MYLQKKTIILLFIFHSMVFIYGQNKDTCPTIGVVLSGGGAKGFAHIGALKVLEKNNIYPDKIAGTSMGAIVGGLYASGYNAKQLDSLVHAVDLGEVIFSYRNRRFASFFNKKHAEKYIFQLPFNKFKLQIPYAISKGEKTKEVLKSLTYNLQQSDNFKALSTPFFCIATDLETGEQVILEQGDLVNSLLASSAFPSLIPPQEINGKLLMDGGIVNNFPVKEMRERGADIIIGVDVETKKRDRSKLKNIVDVLEQISTFKNSEYVKQQRKLSDILIPVNVKDYNVVSFSSKTQLIKMGEDAAEKQLEKVFKLIPPQCRTSKHIRSIKHPPIKVSDSLTLTDINIKGLKNYTRDYVKNKLKALPPKKISYKKIQNFIDRLYATRNFTQINYSIDNNQHGKRLMLTLKENENRLYLKFGLHYDNVFGTGVLTNLTIKNFLFKNSFFSTDLIFGDRLRFNINYFIDNGLKPSFGFNYYYRDVHFNNIFDKQQSIELPYRFINHKLQIYLQSTIFNRYAFGVGMEYDYIKIKDLVKLSNFKSLRNHLGPYAYIKIDSRDQSNFSKKGLLTDIKYKLLFPDHGSEKFNSYFMGKTELNVPITNRFTFKINGGIGLTLSNKTLPFEQQFYLGGFNEQLLNNYQKLYGYDFMEIRTNDYIMLRGEIQYNLMKSHYITLLVNDAVANNRLNHYNGIGIQYGYESPLGPMIFNYTYSPTRSKGEFYLSLGFWF